MLGGNVTIVMLFLINAIFRGAGDAAIAMRVLWLANAINILLGPCLIFGLGPFPKLGVTGAAVATKIGRGTGALFALSRLLKPGSRIDIHARHLRVDFDLIERIMQDRVVGGVSDADRHGQLDRADASRGDVRQQRARRLHDRHSRDHLRAACRPPVSPTPRRRWSVRHSAQRSRSAPQQAVKVAGTYNMVVLSVVGALLAIFAPQIARVFTRDPTIIPSAASTLRIVACGFPFYAWGMVISQSFNGAGDTRTPTLLNLFVFWLWEIPLAYVLAMWLGLGPRGVYFAMTMAFSTLAVASALVFRRGTWKTKKV